MKLCAHAHVPFFVWAESLQPRSAWSPRRFVRDALYARALRGAAGAFALSCGAARDLARLGVARRRIFPAVYPGPFAAAMEAEAPTRERSRHALVYCGRLIPIKGLRILASALELLATRNVQTQLHVIGDGPDLEFMSTLRSAGVEVVMHGAVPSDRVPSLIRRASVLVLPTPRREGWGYVVNEAYAAGIPVVVSDAVGAAEIVVPGVTGFVAKRGSGPSLARAIAAACELDGVANGPGLRRVHDSLAAETFVAYMSACIMSVLDGGSAPTPPWHEAVAALGGNEHVRWWQAWRSGAEI
ncbi:glycosyltransferase [Anaeromyxobacter sp. Red801]|uniref:glycosyltransferase n=1 Tax=Anaeromyxobacter sp. Red801 TaxID=3411632 RepID=UPI003BA39411